MKTNQMGHLCRSSSESGAALVAALFVTILLLTASAFLLSSVGNNSRNTSDVLAETKAYYSAESGLQATINVLRNKGVSYSQAVAHPTLAYDAAAFTGGLVYTADTDGVQRVIMGPESKYKIQVYDPDASRPYTFQTAGSFTATSSAAVLADGTLCIPIANCGITRTEPRTEITYSPAPSSNVDFSPSASNPSIGTFTVHQFPTGTGAAIPGGIKFRIDFQMTSPRSATRTIRATTVATAAGAPFQLTFLTEQYTLIGSDIEVCTTATPTNPPDATTGYCPNGAFTANGTNLPVNLYAHITPVEPYRLVVHSTGYGPHGAMKQLEGVLQKNFFDDLASSSAIALIGPATGMTFDAGTGGPTYCGVDLGYEPGDPIPNTPPCNVDPNVPTGPSIGVTDPGGLGTVTAGGSHATMTPPPDVITDVPDWQQSPAQLDAFVQQYRNAAQNSGTYYSGNVGLSTIGNFNTGTGITFCDGNCSVGPISGGGILIVTGTFNYNGNFSFNGLIVVTGAGGMHRNGGGGGQIVGNIVIAPYNPANLNAGFLPPQFSTNGGGNSDILFGGTSTAFNGTQAVTNLMLGVAEK